MWKSFQFSLLPKSYQYFLVAALLVGICLRLVWVGDMEFKLDESNLYLLAKGVMDHTAAIPGSGVVSSRGFSNPPMGSWVYIALGYLFGTEKPTQICWGSNLFNCLGLLVMAGMAYLTKEPWQRKTWIWATALAAVNPLAVLWQRKIWILSVYPFFMPVFFLLWSKRKDKTYFALLAGVWGAFFCQLHLAAFFFFASFLAFELIRDLLRKEFSLRVWMMHALGAELGACTTVSWLADVLSYRNPNAPAPILWGEFFRLRFWRFFFTDPFGLKLTYSLGDQHFRDYTRSFGHLPQAAHLVLYLALGIFLATFLWRLLGWIRQRRFLEQWRNSSALDNWVGSALLGYGAILTAICLHSLVYRHYLLVCYPLTFLFLAGFAVRQLKWSNYFLGVCWVAQLIVTLTFLAYIHQTGGTKNADAEYGTVYRLQ